MTKAELVAIVAKEAGIPVTMARECVEVMMTGITDALTQGDKVELRGFGSFKVRQRGARTGRNPMTGASVQVEAKRVPSFKPGKELKQALLDDRHHRDE